jgi:hypothetical protein
VGRGGRELAATTGQHSCEGGGERESGGAGGAGAARLATREGWRGKIGR